jgi:F0F1-type ATP synthase assembly protein I
MKLVWWMLSGSILTALILTVLIRPENRLELWTGMLGPLSSAVASWIAMHRKYIRRPEGLTALMIKAFAAKMIFFAVFITVLVSFGWVRPIPFVVSFVGYFLALHMMEAIGLRRLQAFGGSTSPVEPQGQNETGMKK